jgi:hypothetical protein
MGMGLSQGLRSDILLANSGEVDVSDAQSFANQVVTRRVVACLGLLLAASWGVVYLGASVASQVADLYPLRLPDFPYFQSNHAVLLYGLLPLVFMAVLFSLLSPGIFLVLGFAKARRWTELIILGFGASFLLHLLVSTGLKIIVQGAVNSGKFLAAEAIASALTLAILAWRVYRGAKLSWPLGQKRDRRRLYWTITIPIVGLLALIPVIFWQDPSADGFGALESGRSLSARLLPRYPSNIADGLPGPGVGMIAMAYPIHWFVMFFGLIEATPRLPILLYLPVLFCLLIQLIEFDSPRSLGLVEEAALFLALAIYTVTMSFNASYDVYFADIASPAAFETLTVVCMLASIYFLWSGQDLWFFYFALLGYLSRPTGLMVLGLAGVSIAFCARERLQGCLIRIAVALGMCLVVGFLYEKVVVPSVAGTSMIGYSSSSVIARFHFLNLDDFSRINFALFPSGILPFMSLFALRWQDSLGRVLSVLTVMYFAVFYVPAFVALHHFVPVMIFPLVVFWRLYLFHVDHLRRIVLPAAAVAAGVSLWLSLPRHFEINRIHREIGQATDYRVAEYSIDYRKINHADLMLKLVSPDWDVKDPFQELVASPYTIIFYALKPKDSHSNINYIVQLLREPPPSGFTKIADDGVAGLYVRDLQQWQKDRFRSLRTDYQSKLYYIPRTTLFPHWGVREGKYSVDLLVQLGSWLPGSEARIRRLLGKEK